MHISTNIKMSICMKYHWVKPLLIFVFPKYPFQFKYVNFDMIMASRMLFCSLFTNLFIYQSNFGRLATLIIIAISVVGSNNGSFVPLLLVKFWRKHFFENYNWLFKYQSRT